MNRRDFVRHGLAGLTLASLPSSSLRALVPMDLPTAPPPASTGATALSTPGAQTRAAYAPLLERARAALDANPTRFAYRDRVAVADFSTASHERRLHIVDLVSGQATSYLVAHGRGSDPAHSGFLHRFSNEPESFATSEGAYLTSAFYEGRHGRSMRLIGLDPTNNNADMRAIVVHGADYVSEDHIAAWGKIGRSEGCLAVAPHLLPQVLELMGPGRLIYAAKMVDATTA